MMGAVSVWCRGGELAGSCPSLSSFSCPFHPAWHLGNHRSHVVLGTRGARGSLPSMCTYRALDSPCQLLARLLCVGVMSMHGACPPLGI